MLASRNYWISSTAKQPVVAGTLWSGSTAVQKPFLGLHMHRWPESRLGIGGVNQPPFFQYGCIRSHDYDGVQWKNLNPSNGTYSWDAMDAWVDAHYSLGHEMCYTLYGTPTWAAQVAWQGTADAYGGLGGAAPPANNSYISTFVTALISRYVSRGTPLRYLEIWNEPNYLQNGTGFWWGTAAELATMAKAVYNAATAADASVLVLSPGFSGHSTIQPFLAASDGAGGVGADWILGVSWHPYETRLPSSSAVTPSGYTPEYEYTTVRALVDDAGLSALKLYATEIGVASQGSGGDVATAAYFSRVSLWYAALGVRRLFWYSHDDQYFGSYENRELELRMQTFYDKVCGRTLTKLEILSDGTYRAYAGTELLMEV